MKELPTDAPNAVVARVRQAVESGVGVDPNRLHANTFTMEQRDTLDALWRKLGEAQKIHAYSDAMLLQYLIESTVIQFTLLDSNRRLRERYTGALFG